MGYPAIQERVLLRRICSTFFSFFLSSFLSSSLCLAQGTVRISIPISVTSRVCSNWADRPPSNVTAVQLSFHMAYLAVPWLRIGSIVKVIPGAIKAFSVLSGRNRRSDKQRRGNRKKKANLHAQSEVPRERSARFRAHKSRCSPNIPSSVRRV